MSDPVKTVEQYDNRESGLLDARNNAHARASRALATGIRSAVAAAHHANECSNYTATYSSDALGELKRAYQEAEHASMCFMHALDAARSAANLEELLQQERKESKLPLKK